MVALTPLTAGPISTPDVSKAVPKSNAQAWAVAQDFENVFLTEMFNMMSIEYHEDSVLSGGFGGKLFQTEYNRAIADQVTKTGGIGIADAIYAQIIQYQEV